MSGPTDVLNGGSDVPEVPREHVDHVCTCYRTGCMFCDGGLFACDACGAFEGATPDECPGERMTEDQSEAVYNGQLNYRAGAWRDECCQIRRPVYDADAYMAEAGYRRATTPAIGWVRS